MTQKKQKRKEGTKPIKKSGIWTKKEKRQRVQKMNQREKECH